MNEDRSSQKKDTAHLDKYVHPSAWVFVLRGPVFVSTSMLCYPAHGGCGAVVHSVLASARVNGVGSTDCWVCPICLAGRVRLPEGCHISIKSL